jgi:hypothetical protein
MLFCSWLPMTHGRSMPTFSVIRLATFYTRSICPSAGVKRRMASRGVFVRAEEVAAGKPSEPKAPVRGRHLEALRAVAANPGGLRHEAYPTVLPVLRELGYVEERATRGRTGRRAWHLTKSGRDLLAALGIREDAEP